MNNKSIDELKADRKRIKGALTRTKNSLADLDPNEVQEIAVIKTN